ncbi:hypothetical protein ACYSNW_06420 [Enterococcus sp. LJL99]
MENDVLVKGYLGITESTDSQGYSETTHTEESNSIYYTVLTEGDLPLAGEKVNNLFLLYGGFLLILFVIIMKKITKKIN